MIIAFTELRLIMLSVKVLYFWNKNQADEQ